MKHTAFILLMVCCFFIKAQQAAYTISPAKTINVGAIYNKTNEFKISQHNTGTTDLKLKWELINFNFPEGWEHSVCDAGACYGEFPQGPVTMETIPVNGDGFIILDIDPKTISGSGVAKLIVYKDGFRAIADTLTFNIAAVTVGINELFSINDLNVYPNPATNLLYITTNNSNNMRSAYLLDSSGKKVMTLSLQNDTTAIDLSALPGGVYSLQIQTEKNTFTKRLIKLN